MKVAVFDTKNYDRETLEYANTSGNHEFKFFKPQLSPETAPLAKDYPCVCCFVHDHLDTATLEKLAQSGTKFIALRCAGFNNVDLTTAKKLGFRIARVPEYSPHGVAEHAATLLMALNRKIPRAYNRVRDGNFALDGLIGFNLHGKTVGIIGLGKIGACFARIIKGFGCNILAYDPFKNETLAKEIGFTYTDLPTLCRQSDIISLHVPLFKETFHLINKETLALMKPGVLIINTSRGALIQSSDLVEALKSSQIGGAALDVYEEEDEFFFRDLSGQIIQDDILARLLTFPNVIITAHQAFLTKEALDQIARVTLDNLTAFEKGLPLTTTEVICK